MTITQLDIEHFNQFVAGKISNGGAESMVELARQWEAERAEYQETVAELSGCIADMEAGKGRLLKDFTEEMRAKYNIPTGDA